MYTYNVSFKYSNNNKNWISTSTTVKAEYDMAAIIQIRSKYQYLKDIKIIAKHQIYNYLWKGGRDKSARYLKCPECGSVRCEIIVEPERKINWGGILFHLHEGASFTKKVLQQKGHCLYCGCVW